MPTVVAAKYDSPDEHEKPRRGRRPKGIPATIPASEVPEIPDPETYAAQQAKAAQEETGTAAESEPVVKDVFDFMADLSKDVWSRVTVYTYRKQPLWLADKTAGKPYYLFKTCEPFGLDDLKTMHGSGQYRIDVTIRGNRGGGSTYLRQETNVNILDPQFPPNLPVSDGWIKNPANQAWLWAVPLLEAREREAAAKRASNQIPFGQTAPTAGTVIEPGDTNGQLVDALRTGQAHMLALADPTRQLAVMKTMLDMVRPPDNGATSIMLDYMREEMRASRETMNRLLEAQTRQAPSQPMELLALIPQFVDVAKSLGFSRGKEDKPDVWAGILEKIVDQAPVIADAIMHRPQQQQPAREQIIETAPEQENDTDVSEEQRKIMKRLEPVIQECIPTLVRTANNNNPAALRDWFLENHGTSAYKLLKTNIGADGLANMSSTHPVLKHQLPDASRLRAFFEAVFTEPGAAAA